MFRKDYVLSGKHARYVKELTEKFNSEDNKISVFERNIDVYMFSAVIGSVYRKLGEIDKSEENKSFIRKIDTEQLIRESDKLNYIYQLVMLVHNKENDDLEKRIDRAFRYKSKGDEFKQECQNIFNSYVLGGIEVLYEKIIGEDTELEDILNNLYEFIKLYNTRFYSSDDIDDISKL